MRTRREYRGTREERPAWAPPPTAAWGTCSLSPGLSSSVRDGARRSQGAFTAPFPGCGRMGRHAQAARRDHDLRHAGVVRGLGAGGRAHPVRLRAGGRAGRRARGARAPFRGRGRRDSRRRRRADLLGRLRSRPRPVRPGAASRRRPGSCPSATAPSSSSCEAALERDLPVLAICRGSQVLNVALGGDLVQHLPDHVGHNGHKETPGEFSDHDVEIEPGTRLERLLGDRVPIKSHHHQGFGRLGDGASRRPRATRTGTSRRSRRPTGGFALGVLWHPEAGEDARLFEALVAEASAYRALRRAPRDPL